VGVPVAEAPRKVLRRASLRVCWLNCGPETVHVPLSVLGSLCALPGGLSRGHPASPMGGTRQ